MRPALSVPISDALGRPHRSVLALGRIARMTKIEAKVVAAWRGAAADLGFQFTSPFVATICSGERFEALGLVHQFGGRIGMLISVGVTRYDHRSTYM